MEAIHCSRGPHLRCPMPLPACGRRVAHRGCGRALHQWGSFGDPWALGAVLCSRNLQARSRGSVTRLDKNQLTLVFFSFAIRRRHQVREACAAVAPARYALQRRLQTRFAFIWKAHDHLHGAPAHDFETWKDAHWRTYSLGQTATDLFDATFDEHTAAQEREHLVDLGSSRFHSKAKTKHLRHALAVHILEEGRKRHEGEAWCTVLGSESLRFGKLLSDFMDTVDIERWGSSLPSRSLLRLLLPCSPRGRAILRSGVECATCMPAF